MDPQAMQTRAENSALGALNYEAGHRYHYGTIDVHRSTIMNEKRSSKLLEDPNGIYTSSHHRFYLLLFGGWGGGSS